MIILGLVCWRVPFCQPPVPPWISPWHPSLFAEMGRSRHGCIPYFAIFTPLKTNEWQPEKSSCSTGSTFGPQQPMKKRRPNKTPKIWGEIVITPKKWRKEPWGSHGGNTSIHSWVTSPYPRPGHANARPGVVLHSVHGTEPSASSLVSRTSTLGLGAKKQVELGDAVWWFRNPKEKNTVWMVLKHV